MMSNPKTNAAFTCIGIIINTSLIGHELKSKFKCNELVITTSEVGSRKFHVFREVKKIP